MKMKSGTRLILAAAAAALTLPVIGAHTTLDKAAELQTSLQARFPNVKIESVRAIREIPGLYELVTGTEIAYIDGTGNFLIAGKLMDTRSREDLTAQRWNDLHKINFNDLPFDRAIKTVRGDGSRKLAVFADPDCPFCQKLEQEMKDIDNVTIYTFLFPLKMHPDAFNKSTRIWCSGDRSQTWSRWMLDRVALPEQACGQNVVEQNMKLGESLKIDETPTLYLPSGQRIVGTLPRDQLEAKLNAK